MNLFISWSGPSSQRIAEELSRWIPTVVQAVRPWMSSEDLRAGSRWLTDLAQQLDQADFGILCVTALNLEAPWLLFEAGALSKSLREGCVVPYLIDCHPSQVRGPLAQFQLVSADEKGTRRLIEAIAERDVDCRTRPGAVHEAFTASWPRLASALENVRQRAFDRGHEGPEGLSQTEERILMRLTHAFDLRLRTEEIAQRVYLPVAQVRPILETLRRRGLVRMRSREAHAFNYITRRGIDAAGRASTLPFSGPRRLISDMLWIAEGDGKGRRTKTGA